MATSLKGSMVIIAFPFSDLSAVKRQPALVITDWGGDDVIFVQITSIAYKNEFAIPLNDNDFTNGSLKNTISFIRPNKLFTADKTTLLQTVGKFKESKTEDVIEVLNGINEKLLTADSL